MLSTYFEILASALPVFLVLAAGWGVRVKGWLGPEADRSLVRLLVNLFFPCLLVEKILGNPAAQDWGNLALAPAFGFGLVVFGYAVAWVVGKRLGFTREAGLRTFALTTGLFNYGYLAIPVTLAIFPGGGVTSLLMVFNLGVELSVWTVGLALLQSGSGNWRTSLKNGLSAPVIAIIAAVVVNQVGLAPYVPAWTHKTLELLGQCAIPFGVLVSGATLADAARGVAVERNPRAPLAGLILRLGLLPVFFLGVAWLLPPSYDELRKVIITQAGMPAAIFPVVLARHHGGEPGVALQVIVATSLVGLFTLPFWLMLGLELLNHSPWK